MSNAGKLLHILTAKSYIRLGDVVLSTGSGAPSGSRYAYGATTAHYFRDDGSDSTSIYTTTDSGTTWTARTVP